MKLLLTLVLILTSSTGVAQSTTESSHPSNEKSPLIGLPVNPANQTAWIEVFIPMHKNMDFKDAISESQNSTVGFGVNFGWQPFLKSVEDTDNKVMKVLKSIGWFGGFHYNATGPTYNDLLYGIDYQVGNILDTTQLYSEGGECFDQTCFPCPAAQYMYCKSYGVFGRNTHIKYERGGIRFGFYIPIKLAKKIELQTGIAYNVHFLSEAVRTDQVVNSTYGAADAFVKVTYLFTENFGTSFTYGKNLGGKYSYNTYIFGLVFRF